MSIARQAGYRHGDQAAKKNRNIKKKNIGSRFDSFLGEEGICDDVGATAIKRMIGR